MKESRYLVEIRYLNEKIARLEGEISAIKKKQSSFSDMFLIIETKRTLFKYVMKNWWKLAAFVIPMLFMLGEISVQIRKWVP